MTDTPYYSLETNALPSFDQYYTPFSGYSTGSAITTRFSSSFQLNGHSYLVAFLRQDQAVSGTVTFATVPNREVIFEQGADGQFTDVTSTLLGSAANGSTGFSLDGEVMEALVVTSPATGLPELIISESQEDGRAENPGSSDVFAQSQVQIARSDGTFSTVDLGSPGFGAMLSLQFVGGQIVQANIGGSATYITNSAFTSSVVEYPVFQLNSTGTAFVQTGLAPSDPKGAAFLGASEVVTIGSEGGSDSSTYLLSTLNASGQWQVTSSLNLYPQTKIDNFVVWNNQIGLNTPVTYVDGKAVFQVGLFVLGSFRSFRRQPIYRCCFY